MGTISFASSTNKSRVNYSDVLDRLKVHGSRAKCPTHKDRSSGGSLSVKRVGGKILLHCFAGCRLQDICAALKLRVADLFAPETGRLSNAESAVKDIAARRNYARTLWQRSRAAAGTVVEPYLHGRGITISIPRAIRLLPQLQHREYGYPFPALVAGIQDPAGNFSGISVTWLCADGSGKAPVDPARKTYGVLRSGAVRLAQAGEHLVVCEGIETGLSIAQACPELPVWCALGTSNLKCIEIPTSVRLVTIAADADRAGEEAANAAASRFLREGYEVRIARPEPGRDFNDYLVRT